MTPNGRGSRWVAAGSALSAAASSACCWLPLLLVALGISVGGIGTTFERFRPFFLVAAAGLLALGFYFNYFRRERCAPGAECTSPSPRIRRINRAMLWVATILVVAFALFPDYVGALIGSTPASPEPVEAASTVGLDVRGMTCGGCAARAEKALRSVPGVIEATVDFDRARAVVRLAPSTVVKTRSLIEAIGDAGFTATVSREKEARP